MLRPLIFAAAACAALAGPAVAAEDGVAGTTSTGTINVDVVVVAPPPSIVQITGLQDVTITGANLEGIVGVPIQACLYHSSPSFFLVAEQIGEVDFVARSTATSDTVPISVLVGNITAGGAPAEVAFTRSSQVNGLSTQASDPNCGSGVRQPITLRANFGNQAAGAYRATIRLTMGVE